MTHTSWERHEVEGRTLLTARLSVAPLQLPAFLVTPFRRESDRVLSESGYRLQGEVGEGGEVAEWLLLLGAMGLHVFGEGQQLIVQDRPGRSRDHDAHRLRMIQQFVAWNVARAEVREGLTVQRSRTSLAIEVRKNLATGCWPEAMGPGGGSPERSAPASSSSMPATRKLTSGQFEVYLRTGIHPSGDAGRHLPMAALRWTPAPAKVTRWYEGPTAQPRTLASQIVHTLLTLGDSGEGRREKLDPITEVVVTVFRVLALPFYVVLFLAHLALQVVYLVILWGEVLFLGAIRRPEKPKQPPRRSEYRGRYRIDPRAPFVQLHDALTAEGLDRRVGYLDRERWLAHTEEVFADYLALTERVVEGNAAATCESGGAR
jgi:hypothetical protein